METHIITYTSIRKMSMILKTTLRDKTDANIVRNHGLAYIDVWNSCTHTETNKWFISSIRSLYRTHSVYSNLISTCTCISTNST